MPANMFPRRPAADIAGSGAEMNGLLNRRDLLRVGSLSIAATALPAMTALRSAAAAADSPGPRGKAQSVIYLWMGGGVTHIDSFDPKPDAPEEIRGGVARSETGHSVDAIVVAQYFQAKHSTTYSHQPSGKLRSEAAHLFSSIRADYN